MRTKRALFCASMLGGLVAATAAAAGPALPTGGVVKAGSATIGAPTGGSLTVNQASSKAIIDWSSFGVGQGGTVQFDNGSGATLNRVTGSNISSIDGLLSATGSVYLINPNGVIVGKTGVVNTGGTFVASTLDVANSSFLAGGPLTFSGPSAASVVNLGKVSSLGGNVAMIAATVENDGSIAASKGDVGLIAGTTVTMDDTDNDAGGLFSVQVGDGSTSATNTGAITAAAVELRAQQGNVYALAGNTGGVINATGIDASGGTIKLISTEGTTTVTGTLSAQGANGIGGQIETSGETLDLGAATVNTHGGSWLLDPTDLIVDSTAASAIDTALGSGNVTLATSAGGSPTGPDGSTGNTNASGAGDILIESALTWSTASILTLNAYHSIAIDAPISVTGAGGVVLNTNVGNPGGTGDYGFGLGPSGFAGSLSFAPGIAGQALTINQTSYTLEYDVADLVTAMNNQTSGNFALAQSVAAPATSYDAAPVTSFSGTLEGLGNTISGLTIADPTTNGEDGLIGALGSGGLARDIGLAGGSVSGFNDVGSLVGYANGGSISNSYATGTVTATTGSNGQNIGGLAGYIYNGNISGSFATVTVTADFGETSVGGLAGEVVGDITNSFATGAVTVSGDGTAAGGLAGTVAGTAQNTYATGTVSATVYTAVGGLIGNSAATVDSSYATGAVSDQDAYNAGGLVGLNQGTVENSYATGAVSTSAGDEGGLVGTNLHTIENSYATGAVSAGANAATIGGLVGYNQPGDNAIVETSYATGSVTAGADSTHVGGLVGLNSAATKVETSYSTGAVLAGAGSTDVGGLIGENNGTVTDSYWDLDTSGQPTDNGGSGDGAVGLTTAQLQGTAALPDGVTFDPAFAGGAASPGAGSVLSTQPGLYPYLTSFFPTGLQAISGVAYSGAGVSPLDAGDVFVDVAGVQSTVQTGANGYYYLALANGTLAPANGGTGVLAYTTGTTSPTDQVNAATLIAATGTTSHLDIWGDTLIAPTTATSLYRAEPHDFNLISDNYGAFSGAIGSLTLNYSVLNYVGYIATGAGFAINEQVPVDFTLPGGLYVMTTGGPITVTVAQTGLNGVLSLYSSDAVIFDAPVSVQGGQVNLAFNTASPNAPGGLGFGLGSAGFATSLTFASDPTSQSTQALTINGTAYTLEYSPDALIAAMNANSAGAYALAQSGSPSNTNYAAAPVGSFSGSLEGLGNTITGLTIDDTGYSGDDGLIGTLGAGSMVRDIGLVGGLVSTYGSDAGFLVGVNSGAIEDSYATGTVEGAAMAGGLVGKNEGTVAISYATGTVSGTSEVGGLVGENDATVATSYASGVVYAGNEIGGLVGQNEGTVATSYATGEVVGQPASMQVGGLVGYNDGGMVETSYATAAVVPGTTPTWVGGLVGQNSGTISNSYWDIGTTGQQQDNDGQADGAVGLTTAQLQGTAALPGGVSFSAWTTAFAGGAASPGTAPALSTQPGLYPYLSVFYPNGVQAVSGFAYSDSGATTVAVGTSVGVVENGDGAAFGTVATGANGYYYAIAPAGTLTSGQGVIAYDASALTEAVWSSGSLTGVNLEANTFGFATTSTTLSGSGLATAPCPCNLIGSVIAAQNADANATQFALIASGPSFTLDEGLLVPSGEVERIQEVTPGAPLIIGAELEIEAATVTLQSADALIIEAPIEIAGGQLNLDFNTASTNAPGGLSFGLGPTGFAGSVSFATDSGSQATQALAINGVGYALEYTPSALLSAINSNASGNFALADSGSLSGTLGSAPVFSFLGKLEGLGNTISGLVITDSSDNGYDGLFGRVFSGAVVRDLGLVGGSVSGATYVGGLAGANYGSVIAVYDSATVSGSHDAGGLAGSNGGPYFGAGLIENSYATGTVIGSSVVGGLVGLNIYFSMIESSFATGQVSAASGYAGGLVGANEQNSYVKASYATGAVSGSSYVGGLVGLNNISTIETSYATGDVADVGSASGGLVGDVQGGVIANSYWDIGTTGQQADNAGLGDGAVGLTTAQLQGAAALPGGATLNLGAAFAGGAASPGTLPAFTTQPGLYPYLTTFFPNGAQAISGVAYGVGAATPLAVGSVYIDVGSNQSAVTTGANGYYYLALPGGTLGVDSAATAVLAYTTGTSSSAGQLTGASLIAATGTVDNLDIWNGTLIAPTSYTTLSSAESHDGTVAALLADNAGLLSGIADAPTNNQFSGLNGVGFIATDFTIDQTLPASGLYVMTTDGAITVTAAQAALTGVVSLYASDAVIFAAPVTVTAGQLNLAFDTSSATTPGGLGFGLTSKGFSDPLTFASGQTGQGLTINGSSYTLIFSMGALANIDGATGDYALARSLNATTQYGAAVVGSFSGTLEGLGNTISNLSIADTSGNGEDGLIGRLYAGGGVRDLGLTGVNISGGDAVGALVGNSSGDVATSFATGQVSGASDVGGLIGASDGSVSASYATDKASGTTSVGGLVGFSAGTVQTSYATGAVMGTMSVGGLVGGNEDRIESSYASGAVSAAGAYGGGLVGDNNGGFIENSYATGAVSAADSVGGLTGRNFGGVIETSYATGEVSGDANVGGLIGDNDGGSVSNSYFDVGTTGLAAGLGFDNNSQSGGVAGLTTAQFQSGGAGGLNSNGSAFGGGTNGLYPYLVNFFPGGAQAISGFAPIGSTVTVDVAGDSLGSVGVGANGYYYEVAATGTIAGAAVIAYSSGIAGGATVNTLTGTTSNFDILTSTLIGPTTYTSWSTAIQHSLKTLDAGLIGEADAGDTAAANLVSGLSNNGYIVAGGFTINETPASLADGLFVQTTGAGATLTVDPGVTLTLPGANSLFLLSSDALIIDAPITVTGDGRVYLGFNTASASAAGGLSFGLTTTGFTGSATFASGQSGQSLTINGAPYTLEYDVADLATAVNANPAGDYALAVSGAGGSWNAAPIAALSGVFEGLGHTITGLAINDPTSNGDDGLIGLNTGWVRDIGMIDDSISAGSGSPNVGGIVGDSFGTVEASYASGGSVSGSYSVAGVVGLNYGTVATTYSTAAIVGILGVGGLVGNNLGGAVGTSFATGSVLGTGYVGGLVGVNNYGTVKTSYATGAVTAGDPVGGLVGLNNGGTVTTSYATGAVTGDGYNTGGLVGEDIDGGTVSHSYWDTGTTAQPTDNNGGGDGGVGLTTAQLQGKATLNGVSFNLGGAFAGGAASPGANPVLSTQPGLYPYLSTFFPNGAQAIVGTATGGGVAVAGAQVEIYSGGVLLGGGAVSSGANGYVYLAVPAGTLGASGDKIGADLAVASGSPVTGLAYTDAGSVTANVLTLPTLALGLDAQTTSELTLSALTADVDATFGAATYAGLQTALASVPISIDATGASFTVDQAMDIADLTIQTSGALAIDASIFINDASQVALTYAPGGLSFDLGPTGFAGSLSFATGSGEGIAGQALTLNGTSYKLLYSMNDVANIAGTSGDYALAAPIIASTNYTTSVVHSFSGILEGLGNSITDLTISSAGSHIGLIGTLYSGGAVRDLGLIGGSVTGLNFVGGLAGEVGAGATLADDYDGSAEVTATGAGGVGGLVGISYGTVSGSGASNTVDNDVAGQFAGGLVGYNGAGAVISSSSGGGGVSGGVDDIGGLAGYNAGTINGVSSASGYAGASGETYVGGLVGDNVAGATITGASASVTVTGLNYVGGLVGANDGAVSGGATGAINATGGDYVGGLVGDNAGGGTITNATASGATVIGNGGVAVGGLVGYNSGGVTGSSASDKVYNYSGQSTGGLVGYNAASATISSSSASGKVTGAADYIGGLVGFNAGAINSGVSSVASSATGNVTASSGDYVGGLVGENAAGATITGATASGTVTGVDEVGGLAGYNAGLINGGASASGGVSGGAFVGGLVGENVAGGTISGASASGGDANTTGAGAVGGLVGINYGSVTGSTAGDTAEGGASGQFTGGLVGYNGPGGIISSSSASGTITGGVDYTGGLVGYNAGTINDASSASGNVSASGGSHVGGLVGDNLAGGSITGASASGVVTGLDYVGGLAGSNDGSISDASATGDVNATGGDYIGGLVGENAAGASISDAYASGSTVSAVGGVAIGGLVGLNEGTISNTYGYAVAVSGGTDVGGLVGANGGGVSTSWASDVVSGVSNLGGAIGLQSGGTVSDVYWDTVSSGQTLGVGHGLSAGVTGIDGTTGLDPHAKATYSGFNFISVWTINTGPASRPYLQTPAPATPPN